jgi:hypothetical protein
MDAMRGCRRWQPCADWFLERHEKEGIRATTEGVVESETPRSSTNKGIGRRLDAVGWGLFFVWVGVSLLMDLSWAVGLLGVAAIIFLKQAARRYFGRRLEIFWVVVGVFFLLGGVWELYQVQVGLGPILLIVVGSALLLSLFRRR